MEVVEMATLGEIKDLEFQLSEVRLERFKAAFKPAPIKLRPFNVVIGRNGSGKSTLIEALQWLDATIRRDAREACDRYHGIRDLINLRSQTDVPFFQLTLKWHFLRYEVKVQ
jgi:predicted ATPase